ncbi:conserved Plasmodium protein, unknown function [Plasmodium malariae]|uniref:MHD domain-containing protein n=1 Tax=Plasmodium malariae TaxID=5858 RepID=A0A1C3KDV0_PLAMA|nr:conserved Plasmodium protein, unknown function [Plasmodium malariae]
MHGIRALFLFKSTDFNYDLVYQKHFINVEICAKNVQDSNYVNVLNMKNVETIIKNQIINKRNEDVGAHETFLELNRTISCYNIRVKNKIVHPFLLVKREKFILVTLLIIDDLNCTEDITIIENNTTKLLYYNFMNDFLNFVETNIGRYNHSIITTTTSYNTVYNKIELQKFTNCLDSYIICVIPYGRLNKENCSFLNYIKKDMYKCGDILESNFFIFYNFLFLINKDNTIMGKNKSADFGSNFVGLNEEDEEHVELGSCNEPGENNEYNECCSGEHPVSYTTRKKHNDILYVNSKPPFVVYKNDTFMNSKVKCNFFNLLLRFFILIKHIKKLNTLQFSKNYYYPFYLLFFYNYSIFFEKNKKIPIINKYDQNENIKISKQNIQTYVPVYLHEKNKDNRLHLLIKEELTCFITDYQNQCAEIKGDIILKCDDDKYVDLDMTIELDSECCDVYVADFVNMRKRHKTVNIQLSSKYASSRILTYFYKNMTCPFIGFYKFKKINEKQVEINVTLKWSDEIPCIKIEKKSNEYLFLRLPFLSEIVHHNLKWNLGKVKFESKKEVKWMLDDLTRESHANLSGTIEFNDKSIVHFFFFFFFFKTCFVKLVHA